MRILKSWLKGTQKARVLSFSFTKLLKGILSSTSKHRKPEVTHPSNIYHRCNNTPLSIFIDCSVDRDYKKLIRYGHASQEQLIRAWESIYSEYAELTGGQSYKLLMNLSKDIGYLETKHLIVSLCLKVLTHRPDPKVIQTLRNYGYKYEFNPDEPEKYSKALDDIVKRSGGIKFAIDQKRAELEKNRSKIVSKEVTRDHFDKMLAAISKHMGFRVDPKNTTVSEFCAYRYNFEKEIEAMKKAYDKQKIRESKSKSNLR